MKKLPNLLCSRVDAIPRGQRTFVYMLLGQRYSWGKVDKGRDGRAQFGGTKRQPSIWSQGMESDECWKF